MAKNETKERCPRCSSHKFAVATDKSNKHYCSECQHIWVPGMENLTRPDFLLKKAQIEVKELTEELGRERAKIRKLEEEVKRLKDKYEEEIFT